MRVVSMVPSWTETLIECGVKVVGRTRFCIHPEQQIKTIPIVGGTKDIDWQKIKELKPDLILLDKEENPEKMSKESPCPIFATHVQSVADAGRETLRLSALLSSTALNKLAIRWELVAGLKIKPQSLDKLPGVTNWIRPISKTTENFIYVIWHKPWMAINQNTFIGSVLTHLGFGDKILNLGVDKYPQLNLDKINPSKTALLFSSEPYPFASQQNIIEALPHPSCIINGESYSWFGIRSLRFLEENIPH